MEGKEPQNNEEEDFNSKSKIEDDADDFGLPEIEESENKSTTISEPFSESWEVKKEENTFSGDTKDFSGTELSDSAIKNELDDSETIEKEYKSSYYDEDYGKKKSPAGWIIFGVVALLVVIVGVIWWLNRGPAPKTVVLAPPVEQIIKEPEPVEPVITEPVKQPGVFEINQPTGRYHVIVASSIDVDLARDYGNKLAKQGMTCNILAPIGNKKFHRLSVADYVSLNDASLKSEQLKNSLGGDVWVIRY